MMSRIIAAIVAMLDGVLGQFVGTFLQNWEKDHAGDNQLLDYIAQLVASAGQNPTLTTGDQRWQWVFDTATAALPGMGKTIGTSMLNTLIELAVQNFQASMASSAPPATS